LGNRWLSLIVSYCFLSMRRAIISATGRFMRRHWISFVAAFGCFRTGSPALAQTAAAAAAPDNAASTASFNIPLTLGPLNLHPRVTAGVVADDNLLFTSANQESDLTWSVQPGLQAVMGDDAALIAYRDQNGDVFGLTPGSLIVQPPEAWRGTTRGLAPVRGRLRRCINSIARPGRRRTGWPRCTTTGWKR
jgi:hypothetical protein